MTGYVSLKHPVTGEEIKAVPTGKTKDNTAEVIVITPRANLSHLWITKDMLITAPDKPIKKW